MTNKVSSIMASLNTIGDRVRFIMEARGMKQTEVAMKIGLTQAAISNIVTDFSRKPSAPTLLKLAAALQASPYWIITGEGSPFEITTIGRDDERQLIDTYRDLDAQGKAAALKAIRAIRAKRQ